LPAFATRAAVKESIPSNKFQIQYFPNLGITRVAGDGQLKHFSDNDL
jgi:hypothetical protein